MADKSKVEEKPKVEKPPKEGTGVFTKSIPSDFAKAAVAFENSKGGKKP